MLKSSSEGAGSGLSPYLLLLMSVATGLAVAGNYYAQPLLSTIAQDLQLSTAAATNVVTTAQLSYGLGLLLLVPLADVWERKRMIVVLMLLAAFGLAMSAMASGLTGLLVGTAIAGLCSAVAQVLVPFAATLATPQERGRAVGVVMSGLLIGILLARVVAGVISSLFDWRGVYAVSAVAMVCCTMVLARALPRYRDDAGLSYGRLLGSVLEQFVLEPALRLSAALGFVILFLFSLFWTPLAFLLAAPPYEYSDALIGAFGLAGAAGALSANWAGRMADKGKGASATWVGLLGLLLAWLPLGFAQTSLIALLVGVLVLDLAVQLAHVSNQNTIYALNPRARNRLNAAYMTCYFLGGAAGSWGAAHIYPQAGWRGVVIAGVAVSILGIALGALGLRRKLS